MSSPTTNELVSHPVGHRHEKEAHLARLRRIEGQVRGIHRMVGEDLYCIDILTQISAIKQALNAVGIALLDEHVHHCVADASARTTVPPRSPSSTRCRLRSRGCCVPDERGETLGHPGSERPCSAHAAV